MKKLISLLAVLVICVSSLAALSDDASFTYSILPADQRVLKGSPYKEDAIALAKETGTIRFYFMCGEGLTMDSNTGTKWGDSTLIVFPNGRVMLIDGGMPQYAKTLVHNIKQLGITKIDYVVLSHNHPDHFGGLMASNGVLANFPVGIFFWNGMNCDYNKNQAKVFTNGMKTYDKHIAFERILSAGDRIIIGEDIYIEVFNPSEKQKEDYYKLNSDLQSDQMNSESLVLKIHYKDFSALFGGDLYQVREEALVETYGSDLKVDLLKLNHHGKDTSNGRAFAQATSPRVAVAMYGYQTAGTAYGNYAETGTYVFCEYFDGYIRVVSDGTSYCDTTRSQDRATTIYAYYDLQAQKVYPAVK